MTPTLPLAVGLGAQELHRACDVAHHLVVGDAAGGAHARADVVGLAGAVAEVEVRRDAGEAVVGQLARHFLVHSSQPGMWWMTTTPGKGPGPSGRA